MKLYTGTSPWIGSHLYILIESKQFSVFHGKSPRRRLIYFTIKPLSKEKNKKSNWINER